MDIFRLNEKIITHETLYKLNKLDQFTAELIATEKQKIEVRLSCIKMTFIRCSWLTKLKFITQLLQATEHIETLGLLLKMINFTKDMIYSNDQIVPIFAYDRILNDNNRALDEICLNDVQSSDVEWFKKLTNLDQADVLRALLHDAGGALIYKIHKEAFRLYEIKLLELKKPPKRRKSNSVDKNSPTENNISEYKYEASTDVNAHSEISLKELEKFNTAVKKLHHEWNELLQNFKTKNAIIDAMTDPVKIEDENMNGRRDSGAKKDRKNKGAKKNKQDKSSGKLVDQIQQLPLWINRLIISMLDEKSMNALKKVNKYWASMVADVKKQNGTRQKLNTCIMKIQSKVKPEMTEENMNVSRIARKDRKSPLTWKERRLAKLYRRGCAESLLEQQDIFKFTESVLITFATENPMIYPIPVSSLKVFPRNLYYGKPISNEPSSKTMLGSENSSQGSDIS